MSLVGDLGKELLTTAGKGLFDTLKKKAPHLSEDDILKQVKELGADFFNTVDVPKAPVVEMKKPVTDVLLKRKEPEVKLIGMEDKDAAKYSRAVFRDLLSQLKERQSVPKDEWYNGMRVPKLIRDVSAKIEDTTISPGPDAASMVQKSGMDRLEPLQKLTSSSTADPENLVSDAVRTGMLDGKKLSSQQRNELAQRLALVRMVKKGDYPDNNAFTQNAFNEGEPIDLKSGMGYGKPIDSLYYRDFKTAPSTDKAYELRSKYSLSPRDKETMDKIVEQLPDMKRYESIYPNLPLTSTYNLDSIFNKALGLKGTFGKGYKNYWDNEKITAALFPKVLYNTIIKKYKITDPSVAETINQLLPEWKGSIEELVDVAKSL